MVVFIDTSSLFKKYALEKGSDSFKEFLNTVTEIIVSPVSWLELNSILARRMQEKTISEDDCKRIEIEMIKKYYLKSLDSIQLASALRPNNEIEYFIGSDEKLNNACEAENLNVFDPVKN